MVNLKACAFRGAALQTPVILISGKLSVAAVLVSISVKQNHLDSFDQFKQFFVNNGG